MYVDCMHSWQSVCSHAYCIANRPLCGEPHPVETWRICSNTAGHKGKHYVPPQSFNYEYWGED